MMFGVLLITKDAVWDSSDKIVFPDNSSIDSSFWKNENFKNKFVGCKLWDVKCDVSISA